MTLFLCELAYMEGPAEIDEDGNGYMLYADDSAGQTIKLHFYVENDCYTLEVLESAWKNVEAGQTFTDFMPVLSGEKQRKNGKTTSQE